MDGLDGEGCSRCCDKKKGKCRQELVHCGGAKVEMGFIFVVKK